MGRKRAEESEGILIARRRGALIDERRAERVSRWRPAEEGGEGTAGVMDGADICFIHSSVASPQQRHCAPQQCSTVSLRSAVPH